MKRTPNTNARDELFAHLGNTSVDFILAADLLTDKGRKIVIKTTDTYAVKIKKLERLNYKYFNNFGGDPGVTGIIWLKDNSWIEREEYDGAYGWKTRSLPKMPSKCNGKRYTLNLRNDSTK